MLMYNHTILYQKHVLVCQHISIWDFLSVSYYHGYNMQNQFYYVLKLSPLFFDFIKIKSTILLQ